MITTSDGCKAQIILRGSSASGMLENLCTLVRNSMNSDDPFESGTKIAAKIEAIEGLTREVQEMYLADLQKSAAAATTST